MSRTVHVDVIVAAHTAVLGEVDAEGSAAYVDIRDSSNTLLSTLPLQYPAGAVSAITGQLELDFGAADAEAAASGTADHAELCDAAGKVLITLSCSAGTSPVADTCVLSSLSIVAGAPVEGISFTIG